MLSAMLQTPTSWGPTRFLRWETSTWPEAAQANAFYERVFPERHVGQPFVWPAPPDAADITPERYMAFRPRRLMTDQAWLSIEPAFSTQSGRWFARLHELAGERADVPQLLSAVASDGYAHLAMAATRIAIKDAAISPEALASDRARDHISAGLVATVEVTFGVFHLKWR